MRKLLAGTVVLAALAAALAVPALAGTRSITVGDNFYVRNGDTPTVTVHRGSTVKWVWRGDVVHNVIVSSGPVKFRSPLKTHGTYSRRMTRRGTYRIFCSIHGAADMSMKLIVR